MKDRRWRLGNRRGKTMRNYSKVWEEIVASWSKEPDSWYNEKGEAGLIPFGREVRSLMSKVQCLNWSSDNPSVKRGAIGPGGSLFLPRVSERLFFWQGLAHHLGYSNLFCETLGTPMVIQRSKDTPLNRSGWIDHPLDPKVLATITGGLPPACFVLAKWGFIC